MNGLLFRSLTAFAAGATVLAGAPARAQPAYPSQRVSMLIGFAAGGFADTVARVVGSRLGERLGQSFVAQNLEGGASIRATRQMTTAAPDGYTILVTTTSIAINESLVPARGYNVNALEAVAIPVSAPESFSANATSPIKSIADLLAKAKSGKVYLGTPGIGSGSHIAAEYFFKFFAKTEVNHIPFGGGNPAKLALLANDVVVLASTATSGTLRSIASGETTGLAIAAKARSGVIPNVPTFTELGYEGFEAASWAGFFVPAGTPPGVIERLNREINAILGEDAIRKQIDALGLDIVVRDPAATNGYFRSEIDNWSRMVKTVGVTQ